MPILTIGDASFDLHPSGPRAWTPGEANEWAEAVTSAATSGALGGPDTTISSAGLAKLRRNAQGIVEASEDGEIFKRLSRAAEVYNVRDYLNDAQKANLAAGSAVNATAAMQAIFAIISAVPGVSDALDAIIEVPGAADLFQISSTCTYIGGVGRSLVFKGETGLSRGGSKASGFIWTGAQGGTMFDLRAINGSVIKDLAFNGGNLAKYVLRLREYYEGGAQIASSGVWLYRCRFNEPTLLDGNSALVAAGHDNGVAGTKQASEYRFFYCDFNGCNELGQQGWGFRALTAGNTKNFVFSHCTFSQLYRCAEAGSGYMIVVECNAGNIGYDRDSNACMFVHSGNTLNIQGGGLENGALGYYARFAKPGQSTSTLISGVYLSCTPPADDFVIDVFGPTRISQSHFENTSRAGAPAWAPSTAYTVGQYRKNNGRIYRCAVSGTSAASGGPSGIVTLGTETDGSVTWKFITAATMLEWAASTAYTLGKERFNGDKAYRVTVAGTSAASGGPTGTGSTIVDGSVTWSYMNPAVADTLRIRADASKVADGWGGKVIEGCSFPYIDDQVITATPVYDGSNHLGKGDYARSVAHQVTCLGNVTGESGSDIDRPLPDTIGTALTNLRDTMWTDDLAGELPNATVLRNDGDVFAITVPAADLAPNSGLRTLCLLPPFSKLTSCVARVTTPFSGTGLSGTIEMSVGIEAVAGLPDEDGILLAFDAKTAAITRGKAAAHYGAQFDTALGGYIGNDPGGYQDRLKVRVAVGAGSVANLSAGSVTFYIEFKRLGV